MAKLLGEIDCIKRPVRLGTVLLENESLRFLSTNISQGNVATFLRCGGIFNYRFSRNLLASLGEKNENRLAFGKVRAKNRVAPFPDTVYDVG